MQGLPIVLRLRVIKSKTRAERGDEHPERAFLEGFIRSIVGSGGECTGRYGVRKRQGAQGAARLAPGTSFELRPWNRLKRALPSFSIHGMETKPPSHRTHLRHQLKPVEAGFGVLVPVIPHELVLLNELMAAETENMYMHAHTIKRSRCDRG